MPVLPSFLIIGAAKSGTSSLYRYLGEHPQVFMSPVKEPGFLAFGDSAPVFFGPGDMQLLGTTRLEDYQRLFAGHAGRKAVGEASAIYLYWPSTPERIRRYVPGARIIAILRQPAERAFSHYVMKVTGGQEPLDSFAAALRAESERKQRGWHPTWFYRERGFYHTQLARYRALFPRERIRVLLYEDLAADPAGVVQEICRFLEIDPGFAPSVRVRHNPGGRLPRSRRAAAILRRLSVPRKLGPLLPSPIRQQLRRAAASLLLAPARLPDGIRAELNAGFCDDILRLQDDIERDLSHWLR